MINYPPTYLAKYTINESGMYVLTRTWVSHDLKPRDVERRFFACEKLLQQQKRKSFLHRIVTGDEK